MKQNEQKHAVTLLFFVLLLMMFAGSAFLLILFGSHIYQSGTKKLDENYTIRTAVAYVSEKVRQHEEAECISMENLDGIPALRLKESIQDDVFYTYIYFYDNALRELFIRPDIPPSPEMGTVIVELAGFSITEDPKGFLTVTAVTDDGVSLSELIYPVVHS